MPQTVSSIMNATSIQATEQVTPTIVREDDTRQHIEDTNLVNAIRNGRLVQVSWNQLTEDEQRQAYVNIFLAAGWEVR